MNCLVCDALVSELGQKESHSIYKCPKCGFGITKNLKSQKGDYHRDQEYSQEEDLFKNIFLRRINIISKFKMVGEVLEIGCSTGLMLSLLKEKGWYVTGVEISSIAAKKAQNRGLEIITKSIEKIDLKKRFDLIILNHTLEHLEDPKLVIKKCYELLKEDGILYIDVPNFGSLSANILGPNWPLLLPKEHKWHFTSKSLSKLLSDLNFKVLLINRSSGIWDYNNRLMGVFLSLVSFKKRIFTEIVTALPSWIVTQLQLGSDLMIIARKTK